MSISISRDQFMEVTFDSRELIARRERLIPEFLRAARESVQTVTRSAEKNLEEATRSAVAGKLWRAWQSKVYPETGLADNPTSIIFPKGRNRTKGAITAYSEGAAIKGGYGQFLAIPLPAAGQRFTGRGKVPLTPGEWERRTGRRLRFVYRRNRPSLLVADDSMISKSGKGTRAATEKRVAAGRDVSTIPIFVLVPQVNIRARFSIERVLAPYQRRLAADYEQRIAAIGRGPDGGSGE